MGQLARPPGGLKGSWDWLAGASQLPAKPMAYAVGVGAGLVMSGRAILRGGFTGNGNAVAGHLSVYDGLDANGVEVWRVAVPASGVANLNIPDGGILLEIGCWVVSVGSSCSGSLILVPLWHYPFTPPGE